MRKAIACAGTAGEPPPQPPGVKATAGKASRLAGCGRRLSMWVGSKTDLHDPSSSFGQPGAGLGYPAAARLPSRRPRADRIWQARQTAAWPMRRTASEWKAEPRRQVGERECEMANVRIRIALPVGGGGKQAALPANRPSGRRKPGAAAKPLTPASKACALPDAGDKRSKDDAANPAVATILQASRERTQRQGYALSSAGWRSRQVGQQRGLPGQNNINPSV